MEEFIVEHDLHVLNCGGEVTFRGTRGRSFIDVTLVSRSMLPFVSGRALGLDATSSDNQLIELAVYNIRLDARTQPTDTQCYASQKAVPGRKTSRRAGSQAWGIRHP